MGLVVNFDGRIGADGAVSVLDRGFLYGDSIYEVVRTLHGRVFALDEHLARLRQSAAYLYMDVPWSDAEIGREVERTLQVADHPESYVRIVVTRGAEEEISLLPGDGLIPHLIIIVRPVGVPVLNETGIRLVIPERLRNDRRALSPAAKTGNYLNNILALIEARQSGADDALLVSAEGHLTEATTSNFWLVRGGTVLTPPTTAGILHGITRAFVLGLLAEWGIPCREEPLTPADLAGAEEAFLSSSVRLIAPVASVDSTRLPTCPGPLTRRVFAGLVERMRVGADARGRLAVRPAP
jgi:branched-chain amino acid aminotransferase